MEDAVEIDLSRLSVERMKRSMVNTIYPRFRCIPGKCECAHCDAFVCVRSCGDEPSTLDAELQREDPHRQKSSCSVRL
ncbi:hypothetical protein DIPPA_18010 [Diplonema papillatum]|nr:hypothetical protein DIPPA_18010 [Diplonema papillatum]